MLRIKNYQFSPTLIPTLATALLLPTLISLGLWQLNRADEKRAIEASVHNAQLKSPLALNESIDEELSQHVYRPAIVYGHYDSEHQFLHDNRTHQGRPGYHVLTPFVLEGTNTALLINRGWIPYSGRRDNIQDIGVNNSTISIKGAIKLPGRAIVLNDNEQIQGRYPQTIQAISLDKMTAALDYNFLPIMLELDKSEQTGFTREWQPYYGSVEKHNGYAIQWFLMAAILLFLYLKINTKRVDVR